MIPKEKKQQILYDLFINLRRLEPTELCALNVLNGRRSYKDNERQFAAIFLYQYGI